jgi:hypothetical protein
VLLLVITNLTVIYRYAGLGCSDQGDQALFAILHSSKEVPTPLKNEAGMVLTPIRMKPEHPSTALPNSTRIHFGRPYGISHNAPVKSIGLIHTGSMEKLMLQSVSHVYRNALDNGARLSESQNCGVVGEEAADVFAANMLFRDSIMDVDKDITPADIGVVKDIRSTIMEVLGPDITLDKHPPPKEPLLSSGPLPDHIMDSRPSRGRKRARVA